MKIDLADIGENMKHVSNFWILQLNKEHTEVETVVLASIASKKNLSVCG